MAFPREVQTRIVADCLHTGERALGYTLEMRLSYLSDLARIAADSLLVEDAPALVEGLAILSTHLLLGEEQTLHREALPAHQAQLSLALRTLSYFDAAHVARFLHEHLATKGHPVTAEDLLPTTPYFELVALPRNNYATTAYTELLSDMASPTFVKDYDEAIDLAASGVADACLVPFRDGDGQPILSFRSRIFTRGLYISQVLAVQGHVQGSMELALCGKHLLPPEDGATWLLSLSTPEALLPFLGIAEHLGFTPISVTTEGKTLVSLKGEADPIPLLLALHLFCREASVVGCYIQTK